MLTDHMLACYQQDEAMYTEKEGKRKAALEPECFTGQKNFTEVF